MERITAANRESGVAMLEVLIAVLVLSIGLLGVAGMQIVGIRYSQTAYLRSVATFQAYDMADRMRANMAGVKVGSYDGLTGGFSCSNLASTGCSSTDIAAYDADEWYAANARLLPSGSGSVTKVPNSNAYDIAVTWLEKCQTGETGDTSCSSGTLTRTIHTVFVP